MKTELNRFSRGQRDAQDITSLSPAARRLSRPQYPYPIYLLYEHTDNVGGTASMVRQALMR